MKADPSAQRRLLELAEADADLARVTHRRRTLPELAEIGEVEALLRTRRDAVVAADTMVGDLDRDAAKLEGEIDAVRAREDRDRGLLKAGVGARQVTDLEHELETLRRRQGVLEDELLEIMERREAAGVHADKAREDLAEAERRLADATGRRDHTLADLEVAEQRRTADRAGIVTGIPADLLALYERIRGQKGTGAALLRARRCGSCRLELDRSAIGALRTTAADEVLRCEECGVILVRTAESGL
ncbi:MAG TPA: C4-type zinc ribbon domain-containing protein [Pseudonocardiaceae bacterium]